MDRSRTIVITGGTSGIGFGAVTAILRSENGPWHVVLPVRDAGRGQVTVEKLTAGAAAGNTVEAMAMDLSSLASVRAFASGLTARLESGEIPRLHAVVCNAGVQMGTHLTLTADGFESAFGVNHLGHFVLVNELLPVLQGPARVVVVSSGGSRPGRHEGRPGPRVEQRGSPGPPPA